MNMLIKQASDKYYAPSIRELQNANRNSKLVANTLLTALGISLAGYSTKNLMESLAAGNLSKKVLPNARLQRRIRSSDSAIENEFLYTDNAPPISDKLPSAEEDEVDEALKDAVDAKEACFNKFAAFIEINPSLFGRTPRRKKLEQNVGDSWLANRQNAVYSEDPKLLDFGSAIDKHSDDTWRIHYDPATLTTDDSWTKIIGNNLAKLGPQSLIPLGIALGGGLVAAPMLAKSLSNHVRDALPKRKRESDFVDTAKEIYEDAAKELKSVGYKQDKEKTKYKEAKAKNRNRGTGDIVTMRAGEGTPLSLGNAATVGAAALLGYAAYKGMRGFDEGLKRAKNDLSHQTQFLRGWRSAKQLRDYDYTPLSASLEDEPGLKEKLESEEDERVKSMLADLKDSDGIQFNPLEIQRLTADYMDIA